MKKYLFRYLIFWFPAALVASFFNNSGTASQILQWLFAFFFLFGWAVNTGMSAYYFPRRTLSLLFAYTGANILIILWLYSAHFGSTSYFLLQRVGGLFSFVPMEIFIMALINLDIRHELYVTGFMAAACLAGFAVGVVYRRLRPNPYRPRMRKLDARGER